MYLQSIMLSILYLQMDEHSKRMTSTTIPITKSTRNFPAIGLSTSVASLPVVDAT